MIKEGKQSIGAFYFFWEANEIEICSKYLIYIDIPISLLL